MNTIYKYKLEVTDRQRITLPLNYEILDIQVQHKDVCMWVLVPLKQDTKEMAIIEIFGTGHTINTHDRKYISTFQMNGGDLVFHAFEAYK